MTAILNSPVRVYPDRMSVYFFDGDSCADIVSGTQEQQRAVLALVGQAQRMARILRQQHEDIGSCVCGPSGFCELGAVLRDAGVLDPAGMVGS